MSSDLLYYYEAYGLTFIGTLYVDKPDWSEGWSRLLSATKVKGWDWAQARKYDGKPVGTRHLIEW